MANTVKRRRITKRLAKKQNGLCDYCGVPMIPSSVVERHYPKHADRKMTFDHVVPASRGGTVSRRNGVASCLSCNNARGSDISSDDFKVLRKELVDVWPPGTEPRMRKAKRALRKARQVVQVSG